MLDAIKTHTRLTIRSILVLTIAGGLATGKLAQDSRACSTLLVGKLATADGSVLMASSCDGDVMGLMYVMPAQNYPPGTTIPMYWNVPRPKNYAEYRADVRQGYQLVGRLAVETTYRTILLAGNVESMTTGGLNEHGLSIAIEFLPMREGLACDKGVVGPNSNHWTTSLIANALRRTKTAREAIQLIGSLVDKYGFLYYRAPHAGVALPIADENETWLMEIFGPGQNWKPGNGKPGGVWCAQRIPDGKVGCSANRSRIGKVELKDTDHFMASSNIFSLAKELELWNPETPFVWHNVYGGPGSKYNSLREWRALSLSAPSLDLKVTGDPAVDRYPFSVKPDKPITVPALMTIMRDHYQGTRFDLTNDAVFQIDGHKSPLAVPWGRADLLQLLKIKPERTLCTPTSGYVFIAQLRDWLPDPIGDCLWFAYGPANTSCFTPVYAGVSRFPDTWNQPANFTRIDRKQAQWSFRLVHNLTNQLRYQDSIQDVQQVAQPAETEYLSMQAKFENAAVRVFEQHGKQATESFLTNYAANSLIQVHSAYDQLVDYLMFRYLIGDKELAQPPLPRIAVPAIPNSRHD